MKKLLITSAVIALASQSWLCFGTTVETNYHVIPAPQKIEMIKDEKFVLDPDVKIVYPLGNEAMRRNAEFLAKYLKEATGKDYQIRGGNTVEGNILLRLAEVGNKSEAYRLVVSGNGIIITGTSEAGVFYGIQTLRKSIPVNKGVTPTLAATEISDSPRFDYRGAHLDVSRHFFSVDDVKTYIDMMALHNMNRLHWHITDDQGWRIEIKKYPKLTAIGSKRKETVIGHNTGQYDGIPYEGFYTREQAREIVKYAADRYITIIPEIDLPGHMQAALAAYPHLGCTGGPYDVWTMWGVSEDVLCAGNDSVLTFIDDVLKEIMDIFPSEYIHIGGDECPKTRWETCPKCQARIKALGIKSDDKHSKEEYLQSYIINHAESFLNKYGRQMIGWDETLEGGLAPNATVMSWRGEAGGIEAARQHHDVIMTPNTYLYFDYYQSQDIENEPQAIGGYLPIEHVYSYEPMPKALTEEQQRYIKGVQANHWTEYIPEISQLQYMALPRWAALCEVQWSMPEKKDYNSFLKRLPRLIEWYKTEGYNYAKHVFDVNADFKSNAECGSVDITLSTIDNAPIHYTLDGAKPTTDSPIADGVISLKQNADFRAMVIREGGNSRLLSENITFCKSTGKPIVANLPVNKQYEFNGITTLTDGLRGNGNYKTGRWIAFYPNDMDVTIDLVQPTDISEISFTACVEKGDWVFDTRGVTIEVSDDGKVFKKLLSEDYPAMNKYDRNGLYEHRYTFESIKTRYIRLIAETEHTIPEWHVGKGNPAFLFVDEIVVK